VDKLAQADPPGQLAKRLRVAELGKDRIDGKRGRLGIARLAESIRS
jgi:hypothetical protein